MLLCTTAHGFVFSSATMHQGHTRLARAWGMAAGCNHVGKGLEEGSTLWFQTQGVAAWMRCGEGHERPPPSPVVRLPQGAGLCTHLLHALRARFPASRTRWAFQPRNAVESGLSP